MIETSQQCEVQQQVTLVDAVERNRRYPETFHIESEEARKSLQIGDWAKLGFLDDVGGERMWVKITKVLGDGKYIGTLENDPIHVPLAYGAKISFESRHILMPVTDAEMAKRATMIQQCQLAHASASAA